MVRQKEIERLEKAIQKSQRHLTQLKDQLAKLPRFDLGDRVTLTISDSDSDLTGAAGTIVRVPKRRGTNKLHRGEYAYHVDVENHEALDLEHSTVRVAESDLELLEKATGAKA
jgi:hypothetical protein